MRRPRSERNASFCRLRRGWAGAATCAGCAGGDETFGLGALRGAGSIRTHPSVASSLRAGGFCSRGMRRRRRNVRIGGHSGRRSERSASIRWSLCLLHAWSGGGAPHARDADGDEAIGLAARAAPGPNETHPSVASAEGQGSFCSRGMSGRRQSVRIEGLRGPQSERIASTRRVPLRPGRRRSELGHPSGPVGRRVIPMDPMPARTCARAACRRRFRRQAARMKPTPSPLVDGVVACPWLSLRACWRGCCVVGGSYWARAPPCGGGGVPHLRASPIPGCPSRPRSPAALPKRCSSARRPSSRPGRRTRCSPC
jgi:hypothetical protein